MHKLQGRYTRRVVQYLQRVPTDFTFQYKLCLLSYRKCSSFVNYLLAGCTDKLYIVLNVRSKNDVITYNGNLFLIKTI